MRVGESEEVSYGCVFYASALSYGSLDAKLWFWREMTDETTRCSSFWGKIEWICGLEMGVFQGVRNRCLVSDS